MTSYIAHHTKKKQILARKEAALQRLVDSNAPSAKLVAAADEVRDARIRVLRVQRSIIVPKDDADILYAKICLLYTSPSPRDATLSRMPSSA